MADAEQNEYQFKPHEARRADALRREKAEEYAHKVSFLAPAEENQMTNLKWGLLFGVAALTDGFQTLLDWMAIGIILNPILDPVIGGAQTWYLHSQGININMKNGGILAAATIWEMLTDGWLPIGWMADVALLYFLNKTKETVTHSI